MKNIVFSFSLLLIGGSALAHEGHGLADSHWHASDAWGPIAIGVITAIALWRGRK